MLLTVCTVGYSEVRAVYTSYLRTVTIRTVVLGLAGMIPAP